MGAWDGPGVDYGPQKSAPTPPYKRVKKRLEHKKDEPRRVMSNVLYCIVCYNNTAVW
jgi:hypothetical protein